MLLLLAEEPAHGYRLLEQLEEVYGLESLPAQTVYRGLQGMDDAGWVSAAWDVDESQGPPRKVYQITPEGLEALSAWVKEIEALQQTLSSFVEAYRRLEKRGGAE